MSNIKYKNVMEYVLGIINLSPKTGVKLPSESEICRKFQCSRSTVVTALNKLEEQKIIVRKQGQGSYTTSKATNLNHKPHEKRIALIIPTMTSNFVSNVAESVSRSISQKGYSCHIFCTYGDIQYEEKLLTNLQVKRYDGIIIYPNNSLYINKNLKKLSYLDFPLVLLDRYYSNVNIPIVSADHYTSSYNTVIKLIELKKKSMCLITDESTFATSLSLRTKGFFSAIKAHSHILDEEKSSTFSGSSNYSVFEKCFNEYLNEHPETDAVITTSGCLAIFVMRTLQKLNKQIGKDIFFALYDEEIPGFDYLIDFDYLHINQNSALIGQKAAAIMCDIIDKKPCNKINFIDPSIVYKHRQNDV